MSTMDSFQLSFCGFAAARRSSWPITSTTVIGVGWVGVPGSGVWSTGPAGGGAL